jgi:phosphoribosylformimino-5-aminoimidazole carboxamide ribotide isomerase
MKILPVIDVRRGQAVHAIAGDRARYQPVRSVLAASADPLEIARGYRERLASEDLYIADLDSIAGEEPAWELYRALVLDGFSLMVDAGVRDRHLALGLLEAGVRAVVAGLETLTGPERIPELVEAVGPRRLVLSLDVRQGSPIGDPRAWGLRPAASIAAGAALKGVARFLVLDLARIGTASGPPVELARSVLERVKAAEVLVGGGIRGMDDLRALAAAGVHGALLATALHQGTLDRAAIEEARKLRPGA